MAISAGGLRQALDQLADLRSNPVTVEEALERVVATADTLFGVDGTALMLVDRDQALRNLAVSDARAALLEELQAEHDEGPCLDAFEGKEPVAADDLTTEDRWPAFAPAAASGGLLAVLASPIPYSDQAVGVVAVFGGQVVGGHRLLVLEGVHAGALAVLGLELLQQGRPGVGDGQVAQRLVAV
ncbi:MAG TPA: GAF domain-containing protein, partial [Actinomycetes bacterium]|nr:GAF domain-containing protein [Actinomycetes bacterium]